MITLEEFKKKHSDKCRLIGLDLGSKRIGVSICDEKQLIATPLKTINKNTLAELISELKVIIDENNIKGIIIDRKSTRLNSSHSQQSRMPSSA